MNKYLVRLKASVYYDVEVYADDELTAVDEGEQNFFKILNASSLDSPLEWENVDVWEVEELDTAKPNNPTINDVVKSIAESSLE